MIYMEFKSNTSYSAFHKPTGETWLLLGVDPILDQVCVAGWPPTMANLSDCTNFKEESVLTKEELEYRKNTFGHGSKWF